MYNISSVYSITIYGAYSHFTYLSTTYLNKERAIHVAYELGFTNPKAILFYDLEDTLGTIWYYQLGVN